MHASSFWPKNHPLYIILHMHTPLILLVLASMGLFGYYKRQLAFCATLCAAVALLILDGVSSREKQGVAIIGIFKNEAHGLCEWLRHHVDQGVSAFYLIDNGSSDDWRNSLRGLNWTTLEHPPAGSPTIVRTLGVVPGSSAVVYIVRDETRHAQVKLYNKHFLAKVRQLHRWAVVIDLDEFLFAPGEGRTLAQALERLPSHVAQIRLLWKSFGGLPANAPQPPSVIRGFTRRASIVRSRDSNNMVARTEQGCSGLIEVVGLTGVWDGASPRGSRIPPPRKPMVISSRLCGRGAWANSACTTTGLRGAAACWRCQRLHLGRCRYPPFGATLPWSCATLR